MANVQQNSNDNLAGIKLGQQLLASGMDGVKERLKNARAKIDDTKKNASGGEKQSSGDSETRRKRSGRKA